MIIIFMKIIYQMSTWKGSLMVITQTSKSAATPSFTDMVQWVSALCLADPLTTLLFFIIFTAKRPDLFFRSLWRPKKKELKRENEYWTFINRWNKHDSKWMIINSQDAGYVMQLLRYHQGNYTGCQCCVKKNIYCRFSSKCYTVNLNTHFFCHLGAAETLCDSLT